MLSPEDKQLIASYMNWKSDNFEGECKYIWRENEDYYSIIYFDLNDASLCVQKMVEKGDDGNFFAFALNIRTDKDWLVKWLFNPNNFFSAMASWLRSKSNE